MVRSYVENITNHANQIVAISTFGISQTGVNLKLSSYFCLQVQRKLKTKQKPIKNVRDK